MTNGPFGPPLLPLLGCSVLTVRSPRLVSFRKSFLDLFDEVDLPLDMAQLAMLLPGQSLDFTARVLEITSELLVTVQVQLCFRSDPFTGQILSEGFAFTACARGTLRYVVPGG